MKYGIIFWGNSSNGKKLFTLKKKIVSLMACAKPRISCRSLFKRLEMLGLQCEYIFLLMNFIVNNKNIFKLILLYTVSTQEITISFIEQLQKSLVSRRVHIMQGSKFSTV
jgi:hypothetical protein